MPPGLALSLLMRRPSEPVHIHLKSRFQISKVLWLISNPFAFQFGSSTVAVVMFQGTFLNNEIETVQICCVQAHSQLSEY